jgi:RNA polymerase sigma-70 factor (ECF subfamily)
MIKLAKRFAVFDDEQQLWAWLRALSRNAFIDHCRARVRQRRLVPLEELAPEPHGAEQPDHHLTEMLRDALAGLQPDERELIQAAYVDERPLQELADASGQTYKAVESRLARLRHKLKTQMLNQLRHEPEP